MTRVYDIGDMLDRLAEMEQANVLLREAMAALIEPAEASTWTLDRQEPDERPVWEATWQAIEAARALLAEVAHG